jgi:NAD-dependent dihydropyrimidine dehydrogenase PreA subunit
LGSGEVSVVAMEEDLGGNEMLQINQVKCNGCGYCVDICPQQAVTIHDGVAAINQKLCAHCGACIEVCPVGAIWEIMPVHAKLAKGGETMPYGYGRGFGFVGAGFGFRGASSPWPYIGRGRGGLPRCWYPGLRGGAIPYVMPSEAANWTAPVSETDLGFLRNQADIMKSQLEEIESRIQELEKKD